ncbi:hypothetical protein PIB30_112921 [Stylosanthes scabra]|uniref:Putative plant transposon protein domain-containing protein n=1 Tax=Stylosanthes scabra TaxID=79078 RepID=A0ABU6S1N5_9FABA|nr:hypothetical protein [Stylosanthes scabra]
MCEEGAQWVYHRDGRPHYLRRSDLDPMSKGWYEFVCRSILPTTNRSELTVERAMLIHSIIIDENINIEEIIAEQIYKFVYKTDISSSLPFPRLESRGQDQDKHHLPNNILNNTINNHPNSNNNKTFLVSILTLTPPCQTFKGGLTSNKRKIGEASRPSTQEWIERMTN